MARGLFVSVDPTNWQNTEIPRVLAVDSQWGLGDTKIWWAVQSDLDVEGLSFVDEGDSSEGAPSIVTPPVNMPVMKK